MMMAVGVVEKLPSRIEIAAANQNNPERCRYCGAEASGWMEDRAGAFRPACDGCMKSRPMMGLRRFRDE